METILRNISKTTNVITLTNTLLENPHKFLKVYEKDRYLNSPYNFQRLIDFRLLLMFNCHSFWFTFNKVAKLKYLESSLKCLKTGREWYPYDHPEVNNNP